ncbi:tetratricopeptide repeat protein [Nostoc sp. FACHB-110]|uniref:tetratricopeptide repeat protein n=1 Tax=Nostoc sp. FACHB-110 TaxID=2692834 RepID=UPI0016835362|nr:tetratricopeptide repeat protein [Nostoc sp. FACHB-110]MBD2440156.1 tetratricopeptide repeat protein [Nostoc sp. FACHB-110]
MKYSYAKNKQKLRLAPHLCPAKPNIWVKIARLGIKAKSSAIVWGLTATFLAVNSLVPKTLFAQEKLEIKDFDYWANFCKLLGDEKKYEEALAACNQGIGIKPDEAEIWITRTQILLKQAKYSEALVSADRILRLQPKYSLALAQRCEALLSLNKYTEASNACDLALRSDGNWGDNTAAIAWYNKGLSQTKLGQFTEALTSFNHALEINPENSLALTANCQAFTNLNRLSEAISACDAAIKTNQNWGDNTAAIAWYAKGLAQKKNGQLEEAISSFDQAVAMNPQDAEIWLEHGRTLATIGKPEQAAMSYEFAVKLSPKYALALASQSAAFNKLNKFKEAQAAGEQALQADNRWGDESPALAWEQRGIALAGLGSYEEGLASLERAIALKPNYAEAWNNRAVTQWYLGRYSDAIASSDRATQINPKYAQAWFNKGRILKTLERYPQALAAYSKALENTGKFTDKLLLANIWANRSVVLWHLSRNQEALVSADRAIILNPDLSQGWYNRGVVLFDLARYNEAINAYNRANILAPTDANILAGKGVALLRLGNFQEAVTTFAATLALDPKNSLALANQTIAQQRLQAQQQKLEQQKMPVIPEQSKK